MNFAAARENMIEQQIRPWDVLDQRVLDILNKVPREEFVTETYKKLAFADVRLPINEHQKMLTPNLEGRILQQLMLTKTDRILEIGTGSGYLTACMASLTRHVDSVEIDEALANAAKTRLDKLGIDNVTIDILDATEGCGRAKSYQAVLLGGSVSEQPSTCKQRLALGGRLFCFVGKANQPLHHATLVTRISETEWTQEALFETWVEPLAGF